MAGFFAHGIRLALVLCHTSVYSPRLLSATAQVSAYVEIGRYGLLHDVGADGGSEHRRHRVCLSAGFAITASDADGWTDRHDELLSRQLRVVVFVFICGCWLCSCEGISICVGSAGWAR